MTPSESAVVRDLLARVRKAERALSIEKRERTKARKRAEAAVDQARFLHGILLLHNITIPERLR